METVDIPEMGREAEGSECQPPRFEDVYDLCFSRVYNYIWYRVRNRAAADEIVGEVFEKAYSRFRRYDPRRSSPLTWLCAIARSAVADAARRRGRTLVALEDVAEARSAFPGPEEILVLQDTVTRLNRALALLGKRESEVVALRFGGGLTTREVSKTCGISEGNVAVILHRAVRKLRGQLEQGDGTI